MPISFSSVQGTAALKSKVSFRKTGLHPTLMENGVLEHEREREGQGERDRAIMSENERKSKTTGNWSESLRREYVFVVSTLSCVTLAESSAA